MLYLELTISRLKRHAYLLVAPVEVLQVHLVVLHELVVEHRVRVVARGLQELLQPGTRTVVDCKGRASVNSQKKLRRSHRFVQI